MCNTIPSSFNNSHIIGNNLTANRSCTTFVNNLNIDKNKIFTVPTTNGGAGEVIYFGSGTLVAGSVYYYSSGGIWTAANATTVSGSTGLLGIALGTTVADGILLRGYAKFSTTSFTSMTLGSIQYVSTTAGGFSSTSPPASGNNVRIIGYCTDAINDILYFCPDNSWVEVL
jgi:hypothetical protein